MSLEPKKEIPLTGMDKNEVSPKTEESPNTVPINDIMPQNETDNAPMEETAQKSEEAPSIMQQNETNDVPMEEIHTNPIPIIYNIPPNETIDAPMEEICQKSEGGSKSVPKMNVMTQNEIIDAPMEEIGQISAKEPNPIPIIHNIPQTETNDVPTEEVPQKWEEDIPPNETFDASMEEICQKSEGAAMTQNEIIDAPMKEIDQKSENKPNPIPIIDNIPQTETNDVSMEEIPQKSEENPQQSEEKTVTEVKGTTCKAKPAEQEASTSFVMVEEPNTIIELVDLYVPPVSLVPSKVIFMNNDATRPFFSPAVPQALVKNNTTLLYTESTGTSVETPSYSSSVAGEADRPAKGGRRRGRKPATPKPRPTKRRRRALSPPPLPPPPNFLENCINPLENEIYPKVIVQPAHQPWVLPRDLNGGNPPKVEVKPPVAVPVSSEVSTSTTQSQPAVSENQLRQKLQLFGPDVQLSQLRGHDPARYKAVRQEANGDQSQLIFTAQQLVSFSQNHGKFIEMLSAQGNLPTPTPAMISHYFPGPGGQLLASQYFASQQNAFKAPDPIFKVPTKRPPQVPAAAALRALNPTYLRGGPGPSNVFRKAAAPSAPSAPTATFAPAAPAASSAAPEAQASSPPEYKKPPFVITPVLALPSILKHKSQEKLRNTLQIQRAKKAAEEQSKLARANQDKENKEEGKDKQA
ncbi:uncharacterized protein LOC119556940 [Drosophila subpulchrella]|uniref:uncharacterized protein LOC119556940 n=1 Tax=Drosophila subpulchrella TaxID=1486046 RepID=UPI0018A1ACB9|nr:uncharacterized protein LOC119556940 [Drosophila subpulchrella]